MPDEISVSKPDDSGRREDRPTAAQEETVALLTSHPGALTPEEHDTIEFLRTNSHAVLADRKGIKPTLELAALLTLLNERGDLGAGVLITGSGRRLQWVRELAYLTPSLNIQAPGLANTVRFQTSGHLRGRGGPIRPPAVSIWSHFVAARAGVAGLFSVVVLDGPYGLDTLPVISMVRSARRVIALTDNASEASATFLLERLRECRLPTEDDFVIRWTN